MMSKNNFSERLRKMEPRKERFSIRKFSVGAASVLIGLTFLGMGNQSVKADTVQPKVEAANTKVNNDANDVKANDKVEVNVDQVKDNNTQADQQVKSETEANKKASVETTDAKIEKNLETANNNTQHTIADSSSNVKNVSEVKDLSNNSQKDNNTTAKENASANSEKSVKADDQVTVKDNGQAADAQNELRDSKVKASNNEKAEKALEELADNLEAGETQNLSAHGVELPQRDNVGTNKNYLALNLKPGDLKADSTDTSLHFSMTELHGMYPGVNLASNTKDYELHIKLDDRLAKYVDGIKLSAQGDVEASDTTLPPTTDMIKDEDGSYKLPLFAHDSMKNKDGKNVHGVIGSANTGRAWTNPNCIIEFNTQVQNVVKDLKDKGVDLIKDPLVYGVYAYNKQTKKQIGNDGSTGFILSSESPFAKLPEDKGSTTAATNQPYFQSANAWAAYDKGTNSIDIFYNPIKLGAWAWDGIAKGRGVAFANYQIDPALAPYIKSASYYYIPLNTASSPLNSENGFNFSLGKKVADMPVGSAESQNPGYSQFGIDHSYLGHIAKNPTFGIAGGDSGYKVYSRASFQLNAPIQQVMQELNAKGVNVKALQMGAYITGKDKSGNNNHLMSPNTLGLDSFNLAAQVGENVLHQPSYAPVDVKQGESKDEKPSWPENGVINENGLAPTDATFTTIDGTPAWVTVKNPSDGTVTIAPTDQTQVGMHNIPLKVTYAGDGSSNVVYVPIYVSDDNHNINWGKDGAVEVVTDASKLGAHETSDHSQVLNAQDAISSVNKYTKQADGSYKADGSIDKANITASWESTPSTVVTTPSKSETINGTIDVSLKTPAYGLKTAKSQDLKINANGATAKNPSAPVDVISAKAGTKLTSDQVEDLINNFVPEKQVKSYTWAHDLKAGDKTGTVRITFNDEYAKGSNTYLDIKLGDVLNVHDAKNDSDKYDAHYQGTTVKPGEHKTIASPTIKDNSGKDVSGVKVTYAPTSNTPSWATVKSDGSINIVAPQEEGPYTIPVTVTYGDGSSEVTYAPVVVNDQNNVDWHQDSATWLKTAVDNYHKTSGASANDPATNTPAKVQSISYTKFIKGDPTPKTITYNLVGDKYVLDPSSNGLDATGATPVQSFSADQITTAWKKGFEANSNTKNFPETGTATSLAEKSLATPDGEQKTQGGQLSGNSKARVIITYGDQALKILGETNYPDNWCNAYGNYYGAEKGATLTFKQGQDISGLSQDEFQHLINVTDLGQSGWDGKDINPHAPAVLAYLPGSDVSKQFAMSWAPNGEPSTAKVANGVQGIVRIHFNDGTYLDVDANINVVANPDSGKTDHDKTSFDQKVSYQYKGQEVASYEIKDIAKGSSLSADQLAGIINGNVPSNYTIAEGYKFPAAENNIQTQPAVIIVPLAQSKEQHHDSNYDAQYKISYVDADENNKPVNTKYGKADVTLEFNTNDGLKSEVIKSAIDNNIPKGYEIKSGFTYPGDQTELGNKVVQLVHAHKTTNPTDPGVDPTDPKNGDMFADATRTIHVTKPDGTKYDVDQTVNFGRSKTVDEVTGDATYGEWKVGKLEDNGHKFVETNGKAEFPEWDVPQYDGYTSLVDGKPATKVNSQAISFSGKQGDKNCRPQSANPVQVTYQNNTKPSQPTNPTNPTQPSSVPETPTPEPEQPSAPTQPTQASNDNKDVAPKPQKVDHKKSSGRAKTSTTGLGNGERANRGNGYSKNVAPKSNASADNGANAGNNNGDKNAKTLPQTGEKQNKAGIFGLAFAGLAAMLGIAGDRKRNK